MTRPIKVLHVIATGERRGGGIFASQLVGALAGDGVEQRIAILRCPGEPALRFQAPTASIAEGRWTIPGIRVDARTLRTLRRIIDGFAPDVVQANGGEPLKYVLAAERGRGRRLVYRRIGDAAQFHGSATRRTVYGSLMRRAARVVAVADALQGELVRGFGLDPSRVVTIPNAVDPNALAPSRSRADVRASLDIPADAVVVLSLGALTWEKDPVAHVAIVDQAADGRPEPIHLIVGDGPLLADVQAEVARRRASERTRILGTRDDVPDLLAASDVMLLASRTEGMPACIIEAGVAGLPVVAYALSGVPEVVVDGSTGALVMPGDRAGIADALARVLADGSLRRRLGGAARERCLARFDIRVVASAYRDLYRDVVAA